MSTDWTTNSGGEPQHGGLFGHAPLPPTMQGAQPPTALPTAPGQYGAQPGIGNTWGNPSSVLPHPILTPPTLPMPSGQQQDGQMAPAWGTGPGAGKMAPGYSVPTQPVLGPGGLPPGQAPVMQQPGSGLPPTPGYVAPAQNPVNSAPNQVAPISGGAQSSNPLQPNPGEIAATAPANVQQFGATPLVNPTYAAPAQQQAMFGNAAQQGYTTGNAATVDPNQNLAYMQQYEGLLAQGLAPQFQAQNQNLADQEAARGITNSGTGQYLQNQLYGQQASALASGLQPIVSQGYGYTQQDIQGNQGAQNQFGLTNLGYANQAQGANAGYQQQINLANLGYGNAALGQNAAYTQQANMANAGASNEANVLNAQYYNQDRMSNYGAYNNYENELLGLGAGNFNALQAAYLNSFGPNTGVESAYGNALSGQQSVYGNVFGNAINNGNNMLGSAFGALGAG